MAEKDGKGGEAGSLGKLAQFMNAFRVQLKTVDSPNDHVAKSSSCDFLWMCCAADVWEY
jgi:hypothetical protein